MNKPSTQLSGNGKKVFEKHIGSIVIALIMAIVFLMPMHTKAQANLTYSPTASTATWTAANWSPTGATPFTTAWPTVTPFANAIFTAANPSKLTFASATVGNITVNPGFTFTVTAGGTLTTNGTSVVTVGTGSTLTWTAQAMAANASFDKEGAGTWSLGAVTGLSTGAITLGAGTLSTTSGSTTLGTGTLTINGGTLMSTGGPTYSNPVVVGGNFTIATSSSPNFASTVNLGTGVRTITISGSASPTFGGIISNTSGGITYTTASAATGTYAITGTTNTYSGVTTITSSGSAGAVSTEVDISGDGSLGAIPGSVAPGSIILDGGRLGTASNAVFAINSNRGIQVSSAAGTSISVKGTGDITYNGIIADYPTAIPGAWAKQGGGILLLGGISTYTGATAVNNGQLQIGISNALPTGTLLSMGQAAAVNVGILDLMGNNQTVAGLISTSGTNASSLAKNTVTASTGSSTLTIAGSSSYIYGDGSNANSGMISGPVSLSVTGGGTEILGDINTFTGNITVSNGELRFNPNSSATGGVGNTESLTSSSVILSGGTLGTTNITTGAALSFSTLSLQGSSAISKINLGSNVHTISFAASNGTPFAATSDSLKITGWMGGYNGTSGTAGQIIFLGAPVVGLTTQQLSQIEFIDGSGSVHTASLLSTGELVPNAISVPALIITGAAINFGTQAVSTSSASQSFSLSGSNLTPASSSITITAPSTDFTVSSDNVHFGSTATISYSSGAFNASNTPNVYVIFNPQSAGNKSGSITTSGGGVSVTPSITVSGAAQATYKSAQSGNWSSSSTWVGGIVPLAAADIVEIQNTHTVTVDATDNSIASLTIDAGGTLSFTNNTNSIKVISGAGAKTIVNGTLTTGSSLIAAGLLSSTSLEVGNGGVFTNSAGNAKAVTVTNFSVDANGTYNHDAVGSVAAGVTTDFPGSSSITLDNASTVVFTKWAQNGSSPVNLPIPVAGSWGNLTLNIGTALASGSWGQKAAVVQVHGTFNVLSTGSVAGSVFALTKSAALPTVTFGGDVNISGGNVDISNTATNVFPIVNIAGNLNVSGTGSFHLNEVASGSTAGPEETLNITGKLNVSGSGLVFFDEAASGSGAGTTTVNIADSLIVSGGTLDLNTAASGAGAQTVNVNIGGNVLISGTGSIIRSGASTALAVVNFNKASGTQMFASTTTGINSNKVSWNVGDGSSTNALQLNSDFVMSAGSKLTVNTNNSIICGQDLVIDSSLALLGASSVNLNAHTLSLNLNAPLSGANASGSFTASSTSGLIIGGTAAGGGTFNFTSGSQILKTLLCNGNSADTLGTHLDITAGNPAGTVTVNTGSVLHTQNNLTLKSDANGTASVGTNTSGSTYITGNVTVERYIPANSQRAWRLLSVPTQTTQTINQSWQEGFSNDVLGITGFGTIITAGASDAAWSTNGFDTVQVAASMLSYNQSGNSWSAITTTNGTSGSNPTAGKIATTSGYFLYVRGDREELPSSTSSGTTATVLRTSGPLYQGTQSAISASAGQYALVGNIYASAIDFSTITPGGGLDDKFYVWDPKLLDAPPSLGAYVTFSEVNGWDPVPGAAGFGSYGNTSNSLIQSGQAFFVHATGSTGSITLNEASKVSGSAMVFRPAAPTSASGRLTTNLYKNGTSLADGNVTVFNTAYSDTVDGNDALKLSNTQENFGLIRSNQPLVIEARQPVTITDTLYYDMWNMTQQQYKLEFTPDNMNTNLTGYLKDNYLGTQTPISLSSVTDINFTVDANAASSASNRFSVVLSSATPVPVNFTSIDAKQQSNGSVTVSWKVGSSTGIKQYAVQYSTDGTNFNTVGTVAAKGDGAASYSFANASAVAGVNYYRVEGIGVAGDITYSSIANLAVSSVSGISVYPNPVTGNHINIQFNNLAAGIYVAKLLNMAGKEISNTQVNYAGGNNPADLDIPAALAAGNYKLEVSVAGKAVYTTSLIIQ